MQKKERVFKKAFFLVFTVMALIFTNTLPGYAHGRFFFRGGVWIGPGWYRPWYAPYYPYYHPYYWSPPVIVQPPPVYEEEPAPPQPEEQEQNYWYYCPSPQGYYPYIKRCPSGWMKVVPAPTPPDAGGE
ncbi:MAG: hypothetical protein M0022_07785 [Desulfobacteraceae bacterium]|nr:hypothetical protein [Desulfobacteraceae bacterium]